MDSNNSSSSSSNIDRDSISFSSSDRNIRLKIKKEYDKYGFFSHYKKDYRVELAGYLSEEEFQKVLKKYSKGYRKTGVLPWLIGLIIFVIISIGILIRLKSFLLFKTKDPHHLTIWVVSGVAVFLILLLISLLIYLFRNREKLFIDLTKKFNEQYTNTRHIVFVLERCLIKDHYDRKRKKIKKFLFNLKIEIINYSYINNNIDDFVTLGGGDDMVQESSPLLLN
ncbi:hypothetical protein CYY_003565 [Polysphondylium violaceum]|uniref:Uncharacterized protein n=1 Tax=Polysphondylium violaceum TaxID=133409 RepID=A0A8J4PWK0_9MYCE|nr:hypothetical protein CYY_003565 [Polysphondylium violaceum]